MEKDIAIGVYAYDRQKSGSYQETGLAYPITPLGLKWLTKVTRKTFKNGFKVKVLNIDEIHDRPPLKDPVKVFKSLFFNIIIQLEV